MVLGVVSEQIVGVGVAQNQQDATEEGNERLFSL